MKKVIAYLVLSILVSGAGFAQRADLSGLKFCIDPGHGGHSDATDRHVIPDPGTNYYESESNFQKALWLKPLLEAKGATVILTRYTNDYPTDNEPSLAARVATANANNVNWFHSIHSNATGSTNNGTNYTLVMVREKVVAGGDPVYGPGTGQPETQEAWNMAPFLGQNLLTYMRTTRWTPVLDWTFYGGSNGGYTLGVLRGLQMPGELSEGEFHDYFPITRLLMNNSYCKLEAYALRDGFLKYFGVPADTLCIVSGILKSTKGNSINGVRVRMMPENIIFNGDNYNNGFFMFDSLRPGQHTLLVETPNFTPTTTPLLLAAGSRTFVDQTIAGGVPVTVSYTSPTVRDTLYPVDQTIGISFTLPMDTLLFPQAFSITPAVSGTLKWYNNLTTVIFKPAQPLQYSTWYTYRIDGSAKTTAGGALDGNSDGTGGDAFSVTFRTMAGTASGVNDAVLSDFSLAQNYPNPFNPSTKIEFNIKQESVVTLTISDILGRTVRTLVGATMNPGHHVAVWDGKNDNGENVSSGIYLYQLRAGSMVLQRKMILMK